MPVEGNDALTEEGRSGRSDIALAFSDPLFLPPTPKNLYFFYQNPV